MKALPIDEVLPELLAALDKGGNAVLVAEPGAGKTTRVPLALMEQKWLAGGKIIMLEPRRLAARSAAAYMAETLGEKAGERIGYRVRMDAKVGPRTVVEVVTEGVLTRMLQADPALEGVAAILFDEFHERHLHGDLGLALSLQAQSLLREDLRIVVMSATLDAAPVAVLLGGAPVIHTKGRAFPVVTRYAAIRRTRPLEPAVGKAVLEALRDEPGDVLVFLPGVAEIRRTARWLAEAGLPPGVRVAELHGSMPLEAQSLAIAPCAAGERKVVLATSIAESSLTVEGVRVVVDSGLMRVPRFSPRTGLSRLETVQVSKASADQRRGRAGRLAPGVCYRLWTEVEHAHLPEQGKPEIMDADLASLALELAVWGVKDPLELNWLTPPPEAAFEGALTLLQSIHALDAAGKPTASGERIARLGLHPRLGAMLWAARGDGAKLRLACELAALLSERDLLGSQHNVDLQLRVDGLRNAGREAAAQRVKAQAEQWLRMLEAMLREDGFAGEAAGGGRDVTLGALLARAYPDRIAQRRPDGRYLLANGRGAVLPEQQPLSRFAYLVVCELDDAGSEGRIRLAAAIEKPELENELSDYVTKEEAVEWDPAAAAVRARRRLRLGALTLSEGPLERPDPELVANQLLQGIRQKGIESLPLGKSGAGLLARMRLMQRHSGDSEWPDVSEEALLDTLEQWLKPHLYGLKSLFDLSKLQMTGILTGLMSWKQSQELDEQVPTHIVVPSGSRIPIDYSDPESPVLAVRLQEMFGLKETPRIARGRLPLTLHLLSPSQRPVQVTRDLASFWEHAYFDVKKDLKGRYPKHYWPDNPYEATATNRAKPRS